MGQIRKMLTKKQILALPGPEPGSSSNTKSHKTGHPGLYINVSTPGRGSYSCTYNVKRKKYSKTFGRTDEITLKEAIAAAKKFHLSIIKGELQEKQKGKPPNGMIFSDFSQKYINEHSAIFNKSTRDDRSKLNNGLLDRFGSRPMHEIDTEEVESFLIALRERLSPASINRYRALLSSMFSMAIKWKIVELNPVSSIKKLAENNQRTEFLKPEQVRLLFNAMEEENNRVAVLGIKFLIFTGLRLNEALKAPWENFDDDTRSLFLADTKAGKSRTVPLNDNAIEVIEELKKLKNGKYIFPGKIPDSHFVNLNKVFNRNLNRCGLPHFCLHHLRHTYCSWLAMAGVPLMHIQHLVGHVTPAMTMRYAHLGDKTLRDASQHIGKLLK